MKIEVALQWTESTEETYRSYANGIRTPNGGTHENGLKSALRKAINAYIETHDIEAIIGRLELGYSYEQLALVLRKPTPEAARLAVRRALGRLAERMQQSET